MDNTLYDELFNEPRWHRWADMFAITIIVITLVATALTDIWIFQHRTVTTTHRVQTSQPQTIRIEQI